MTDATHYVKQMYKYARYLQKMIEDGRLTPVSLGSSLDMQLEVTMLLQIIGEGAAGIRRCGYTLGTSIPLGDIAGMRNRISHDYEGIDWNIVEEVVFSDVPELVLELSKIMDERGIERIELS